MYNNIFIHVCQTLLYLKGEREQTRLDDDQLPRKDIARHIELVLIGPGLTFTLVHKLDCMRERFSIDVDKLIFMLDLIRPKRVEHLRNNANDYRQIYEAEYEKIVERAFAVYDTDEDILMAQQRINDDQTHARQPALQERPKRKGWNNTRRRIRSYAWKRH